MSTLSIILLFPIKNLSEVGEKYAQIKQCLQMKTVQNRSKQICLLILMWEDNRGWTFYRGSIVMDYELVFWPEAIKLKGINEGFVSYKHAAFHFTRHQLMDWSLVDYLCMFLSAVWCKLKKNIILVELCFNLDCVRFFPISNPTYSKFSSYSFTKSLYLKMHINNHKYV